MRSNVVLDMSPAGSESCRTNCQDWCPSRAHQVHRIHRRMTICRSYCFWSTAQQPLDDRSVLTSKTIGTSGWPSAEALSVMLTHDHTLRRFVAMGFPQTPTTSPSPRQTAEARSWQCVVRCWRPGCPSTMWLTSMRTQPARRWCARTSATLSSA